MSWVLHVSCRIKNRPNTSLEKWNERYLLFFSGTWLNERGKEKVWSIYFFRDRYNNRSTIHQLFSISNTSGGTRCSWGNFYIVYLTPWEASGGVDSSELESFGFNITTYPAVQTRDGHLQLYTTPNPPLLYKSRCIPNSINVALHSKSTLFHRSHSN